MVEVHLRGRGGRRGNRGEENECRDARREGEVRREKPDGPESDPCLRRDFSNRDWIQTNKRGLRY